MLDRPDWGIAPDAALRLDEATPLSERLVTATLPLNPLVLDVPTPPVAEAAAWRAAYDGRGGSMIDMAQAAPGYPPHPSILAALARAAGEAGVATYGAIPGDAPLRAAYAAHVSEIYGAPVAPEEIAITSGCNMAFFAVAMALARPGEAVIVPTPWYFNHEMTLSMLGVEARALPCLPQDGFLPDPARAEALIDDKVRALLLVSPNNPTGAVYPRALIETFAKLCQRKGIWLILDETYRDFLPAGAPHGELAGPRRAGVIQLYSFSKAYCIPGHRLGAALAPPHVTTQLVKILDCLQICPPRAGQQMLPDAIAELGPWREETRLEIERRAAAFRAAVGGAAGWRIDSLGAYFAFVAHPYAEIPALEVSRAMARELGVITLPGPFFGSGLDTHLRMAFANADAGQIAEVGRRLARWGGPI
jgi:aspartate/methionine/tyrosine aminotransferase